MRSTVRKYSYTVRNHQYFTCIPFFYIPCDKVDFLLYIDTNNVTLLFWITTKHLYESKLFRSTKGGHSIYHTTVLEQNWLTYMHISHFYFRIWKIKTMSVHSFPGWMQDESKLFRSLLLQNLRKWSVAREGRVDRLSQVELLVHVHVCTCEWKAKYSALLSWLQTQSSLKGVKWKIGANKIDSFLPCFVTLAYTSGWVGN